MNVALPQLDAEKQRELEKLEMDLMSDMYTRLTSSCHRKCIAPKYMEAELGKGESVCLDRCVAKFLEIHERVGKKLTEMTTKEEQSLKKGP